MRFSSSKVSYIVCPEPGGSTYDQHRTGWARRCCGPQFSARVVDPSSRLADGAMPREEPAGRTLRSMGLVDTMLDDITWHNGFRFLGVSEPRTLGGAAMPPQW